MSRRLPEQARVVIIGGGIVGVGWAARSGDGEAQVDAGWIGEGAWEIEIAGRRFPARAALRASYDPKSERVRS